MRSVLTALAGLFRLSLLAQPSWSPAGIPIFTTEMRNIYTDTLTDALYFCGESSIDGDFDFSDQGISVYTGGQWDTLGPFGGMPQCAIRWGDTLVIGGAFVSVDGLPIQGCAARVNNSWLPFGDWPAGDPYRFRIIDDELYALGAFEHADGHLCNGIAKRSGGQWMNVGHMLAGSSNYACDLVEFNGHLILTGAIHVDTTDSHGVAILNDTMWEPLGPGISGALGSGRALAVYQGDLYVGGAIDINDGNAGHGIMRWDGEQFHPVGDGLQGMYNDFSMPTGASVMQVRDGLLYCSGQFRYAGHVPAIGVATWDGTNWCGLGGDLRLNVESFDFYHDTLFVGPFHEAEGVDVNCAAKYIGTYPDTCTQLSTGIPEATQTTGQDLYVSLGSDQLQVRLPSDSPPRAIRLFDVCGQLLARSFGTAVSFSLVHDAAGVYLVCAEGFPPQRVAFTDP